MERSRAMIRALDTEGPRPWPPETEAEAFELLRRASLFAPAPPVGAKDRVWRRIAGARAERPSNLGGAGE